MYRIGGWDLTNNGRYHTRCGAIKAAKKLSKVVSNVIIIQKWHGGKNFMWRDKGCAIKGVFIKR